MCGAGSLAKKKIKKQQQKKFQNPKFWPAMRREIAVKTQPSQASAARLINPRSGPMLIVDELQMFVNSRPVGFKSTRITGVLNGPLSRCTMKLEHIKPVAKPRPSELEAGRMNDPSIRWREQQFFLGHLGSMRCRIGRSGGVK